MSKITIVGGDIIEYIGGKDLSFAKEEIINIGSQVILNGKESGVSYGESKLPPPTEFDTKCVVFFAPKHQYRKYGFDYFVDENNNFENLEEGYQKSIITGYRKLYAYDESGQVVRRNYTKEEAIERFKYEYKRFVANMGDDKKYTYYVPYVTLFSEEFVKTYAKENPQLEKDFALPYFEAELDIWIDVEEDEVGKYEWDYKDHLFSVSEVTLPKTKTGKLTKIPQSVTIKCLKDFDQDEEIKLYYIKKDDVIRNLAGKLIFLKNNTSVRKEENIVFVKTLINEPQKDIEKIIIKDNAKSALRDALYQAFILPKIEEIDFRLPLTERARFSANGEYFNNDNQLKFEEKSAQAGLKLREVFVKEKPSYEPSLLIFATLIEIDRGSTKGYSIYGHRTVVFFPNNLEYIYAHEICHALDLQHTHFEDGENPDSNDPIETRQIDPNLKYAFEYGATGNVMSYHKRGKENEKIVLWKWQWEIMNPKINSK